MSKIYYDQKDHICQEVALSVQQIPTIQNLNTWFEKGYLYVFDAYFLREICNLSDNVAWNLFEACPYERFCQFDYVASLAIDKYIQEAKAGLHDNTNLDTTTQIVSYAASLSPNSSIEIESETKSVLFNELGRELYNKLFYRECETQISSLSFLKEIKSDQVFYRVCNQDIIKLAKVFFKPDNSCIIKFREESQLEQLEEMESKYWGNSELNYDDLDCVWKLLEEPLLSIYLNTDTETY